LNPDATNNRSSCLLPPPFATTTIMSIIFPSYATTPLWFREGPIGRASARPIGKALLASGARQEGHVESWLEPADYFPPYEPHYKVTIRIERPEHYGYCSDVEAEEDDDIVGHPARIRYVKEIRVKAFPMNTWDDPDFVPRCFGFYNGCVDCEYGGSLLSAHARAEEALPSSVRSTAEGSGYCRIPTKVSLLTLERFL
jgi:hypothetical protein